MKNLLRLPKGNHTFEIDFAYWIGLGIMLDTNPGKWGLQVGIPFFIFTYVKTKPKPNE